MERREFMKQTLSSAGIMASVPLTSLASAQETAASTDSAVAHYIDPGYQAPEWLRYTRAVYFDGYSPPVYPTLKAFDAKHLVECVVHIGGDSLRFQPIGYWACYQSKVFPMHPDLGTRDFIDEVAPYCRENHIHLFCYTGYGHSFLKNGWVDNHPEYLDWVRRDLEGKPIGSQGYHLGWAPRQHLCALGDTYRAAMRTVVREFCEHDIEGIYFDAPSCWYYGPCFCDNCRANFKQFSGMPIERLIDSGDTEARIAWYAWANQCTEEDLLEFRKIIHDSGKFMLCHNGSTWQGTALPMQYRIPDGFMIEHAIQTHERLMHGMLGASMARPYKKLPLMYLGSYCLSNFGQPVHNDPWTAHNTNLEDEDEIRMEGFANLAAGGSPLYATLNRLYFNVGGGSDAPVREVFSLMKAHESLLKDSVPIASITLLLSWESLQTWRKGEGTYNSAMTDAFFLAMLDARVAVDIMPTLEMTPEWLATQRVVALCGSTGVSDEHAGMLSEWVANGGAILATYDSGLYNEQGEKRIDGGALRDVLGVHLYQKAPNSAPECYIRVLEDHPALGSFKKGDILQGDGRTVRVQVADDARVLADNWNLGYDESRGQAIVYHPFGKGKAIYLSGSLEAHYITSRVRTNRELLAALVRFLGGNGPQSFEMQAPLGVYGIPRQTVNGDILLWVLAAVGFKDAAIGRMRQEFVPVHDIAIRVFIPDHKSVKKMWLKRSDHTIPFEMDGQYVVAMIPKLHIAELVHVELG